MTNERPNYNKLEQKQAKKDGAKVVKNSGRGSNHKGDAILDDLMLDYKFCGGKSFSLNLEKFVKHERDAWRENKQGIIVAIFERKSIAILDWNYLQELLGNGYNCSD